MIHDFAPQEVVAAIDRDCRDAAAHYPAGFVQLNHTLLEAVNG